MLDRFMLTQLRPALDRVGAALARRGVSADAVTWIGFGLGVMGAASIALSHTWLGGGLLLASRLADGLDGAVARATQPTDRGAFLDITLDFLFYASVPLAFAVADPAANALAAAVLLACFIGTGASFLAFAALAERRGLRNLRLPNKGFYFLGGLTEGTETLICFALMCAWPEAFALWAYGFALLCGFTIVTRLAAGLEQLG